LKPCEYCTINILSLSLQPKFTKMQFSRKQVSIIGIVAISSFMGTFLISSVNIALPEIEKSFGLNAVSLSWVITAFLLATALFLLPVGRLADLSGVKRIFKWGVLLFTLSSLVCSFIPSGGWFIFFRFVQGIGASFTSATGAAIMVSSFAPQYRGRVLGISVSAVYLGLAVGPFVGGMLTQYAGWRSIFVTAFVLGIFISFISFMYLGKDELPLIKSHKPKLYGTIFYMLALVLLLMGSSDIPSVKAWIMMLGGLSMLVIFWIIERKSTHPIIETKLFTHNKLFAFSNLAALINYSATFAIVFLLSLYLQKIQGFSPQKAGTILIAQPVVMAIFSPVAGRLSDKWQPRLLATAGMSMITMGLAAFAFLSATTPIWVLLILLVWVGFGFSLFSSPNMNTIMSSVDKKQYGLASGTAATMRVLGQMVSMTIATLFFSVFLGKNSLDMASNQQFLMAVKWAFISFTLLSSLGIYFSMSRGKMERSH